MSRTTLAFGLLAAALAAVALLIWSPFPAGIWHDDGVYLLLGRSLAEGGGLAYQGVVGEYPAPKFPPLYPLFLAGLWAAIGDLGGVTLASGVFNLLFLAAGSVLFAHLLHRRLGVTPARAAGLAGLTWLPLPIWRSALVSFSEPLFMLVLTAAMLLACRVEGKMEEGGERPGTVGGPGWHGSGDSPTGPGVGSGAGSRIGAGTWAATIAALLLAIHVRTAGVALAAALVLVLLARGGKGRAGLVLGGVVLGALPWTLWSARATAGVPEPLRDVLGSYGSWLLGQVAAWPGGFLASLEGGAWDLLNRTLRLLLPAPPSWEMWFADLRLVGLAFLVPAFLLGLDRLWGGSRTLVTFLFLYLAIVWVWPYQATRLLVPAAPLLVLVVALGFFDPGRPEERHPTGDEGARGEGAGDDGGSGDGGTGGAAGRAGEDLRDFPPSVVRGWRIVGLGWAALLTGMTLWGIVDGWATEGYRIRSGGLARAVQAIGERVPEGAVVGAPELWSAVPLHADRVAAPSARFLPARPPATGAVWGTPAEQHAIWALTGIDYLVLEQGGGIHGAALDTLRERCGPAAVADVAAWPEGRLVRLDWDAECRRALTGA